MGANQTACTCCKPSTILASSKIETGGRGFFAREHRVCRISGYKEIESCYEIEGGKTGIISSSAAGSVHRARHKKNGTAHAVKQLFKKSFKGDWWSSEIECLTKLDHPYICKIHETWEDENNIFLVMEYCRGGDLTTLGNRKSKKINEATVAVLVRQMVGALDHFHSAGSANRPLVHTDIRLENWLFTEPLLQHTGVEDMCLKMIDYGLALRHALVKGKHHYQRGSEHDCSPRLLKKRQSVRDTRSAFCKSPEQVNSKLSSFLDPGIDIWAIGVIAFFLLGGQQPFPRGPGNFDCERLLRGEFKFEPENLWKAVTSEAKDFIKSCLQVDVKLRPSARELLDNFPWMRTAKGIFNDELDRGKGSPGQASFSTRTSASARSSRSRRPSTARQANGISTRDAPLPSADFLITSFAKMNKLNQLEKAAITAAAHRLPPAKIAHLRQTFEKMDTNGDGVLSALEIYEGLKDSGVEEEDLLEMLKDVDSDGSGAIEYTEFISATYDFQRSFQDNVIWSVFKVFDQDQSGTVTKAELKALLCNDASKRREMTHTFSDETVGAAIQELDKDGDGEIGFEEFKKLLGVQRDR